MTNWETRRKTRGLQLQGTEANPMTSYPCLSPVTDCKLWTPTPDPRTHCFSSHFLLPALWNNFPVLKQSSNSRLWSHLFQVRFQEQLSLRFLACLQLHTINCELPHLIQELTDSHHIFCSQSCGITSQCWNSQAILTCEATRSRFDPRNRLPWDVKGLFNTHINLYSILHQSTAAMFILLFQPWLST
jgi:hypothetical protein